MRPPCFECGELSGHDHHVVPRSRGGTGTVPLCHKCHSAAHNDDKLLRMATLAREGMAAKRAKGGYLGGDAPYGYAVDAAGELRPAADEQAVIARIRDLSDLGYSTRDIAARISAEGFTSRTGLAFGKSQVARILNTRRPAASVARAA